MREAHKKRIFDILKAGFHLGIQIEDRYWEAFIRYTYEVDERDNTNMFKEIKDGKIQEFAMTIAAQLEQKGEQKGLQKGLQKGELIGQIRLAQKLVLGEARSTDELSELSTDKLKSLLESLEAQAKERLK